MSWTAAAFAASTAISVIGSRKASKAAEAQARHQQMLLNMQADEMEKRSAENRLIMEQKGETAISQLRGRSVGRFGRIGQLNTNQMVRESYDSLFAQIRMQKKKDDWDVKMTRMGADAAGQNAADIGKARFWQTAGQLAGAAFQGGVEYKRGTFGSFGRGGGSSTPGPTQGGWATGGPKSGGYGNVG